jgi:hypothetical protein
MVRRDQRQMGEPIGLVEREALAGDKPRTARRVAQFVVAAEQDVRPPG